MRVRYFASQMFLFTFAALCCLTSPNAEAQREPVRPKRYEPRREVSTRETIREKRTVKAREKSKRLEKFEPHKLTLREKREFSAFKRELLRDFKKFESVWSSGHQSKGVRKPEDNAFWHSLNHKAEFPGVKTALEYVKMAHSFTNNPPKTGTEIIRRENKGDVLIYNAKLNIFAVRAAGGQPRTMFRPEEGVSYWRNQVRETEAANIKHRRKLSNQKKSPTKTKPKEGAGALESSLGPFWLQLKEPAWPVPRKNLIRAKCG